MLIYLSSLRRHTRLQCDWSSDVCSSDLNHDFIFDEIIVKLQLAAVLIGQNEVRKISLLNSVPRRYVLELVVQPDCLRLGQQRDSDRGCTQRRYHASAF